MEMTRNDRVSVAAPKLDPADVCTLSPDGLAERVAWIRDEILRHARRTDRLASGLAWELDAAPGLAEKLDHLVALERECCGGIVFERTQASVPGGLRLEVRGVDPDAAVLRTLQIPSRGDGVDWARLAKASGLGIATSLFVCCVVPLLIAALVGNAAATPLAELDQPWAIGLGAAAAGAAAWRWLGRRAGGTASCFGGDSACGPGC